MVRFLVLACPLLAMLVKEDHFGWTDFVSWLLQVPFLYGYAFGWGKIDEFIKGRR
jgi:hypothetical protein